MVFLSGLFIGLFMFLFQPFGMINLHIKYKTIFLLGYGVVTMVALGFCVFVLPIFMKGFFCEKNWTVGRQIFFVMLIFFLIGLGLALAIRRRR